MQPGLTTATVALVGRRGAGKTALRDALIAAAPTLRDQLLDTPGEPELAGARAAALTRADAVLLVLPAHGGLDPFSVWLWQLCAQQGLPRAVVLTGVEQAGADVDEALALCQRMLDEDLRVTHLPVHDDDGTVAGLIALRTLTLSLGTEADWTNRPAEPEHRTLVDGLREDLLETVLADADDDELFDRYLAGAVDGTETEVEAALHAGVRRGSLLPVSVVATSTRVGVAELLDLIDSFGPRAAGPEQDSAAASWGLSEPFHPVALQDNDGAALAPVVAADATLRLEQRAGQTLLWSLGPEHTRVSRTAAGLPAPELPPLVVDLAEDDVTYDLEVIVADVLARSTAGALGRLGATTAPLRPADEPGLTTVPAALTLALLPRLAEVLSSTAYGTAQVRCHERR